MTARLKGDKELTRKLEHPTWAAGPMGAFLDRWRFFVERIGKKGAPVWRGHLRRSIASERDRSEFPTWARTGTNVPYARPMEFGTGTQSDDPTSSRMRHWPPASALETWARDHGSTGFLVARAIGLRGGLKPRRYLRNAADDAERQIPSWLAQSARDIEQAVTRGPA